MTRGERGRGGWDGRFNDVASLLFYQAKLSNKLFHSAQVSITLGSIPHPAGPSSPFFSPPHPQTSLVCHTALTAAAKHYSLYLPDECVGCEPAHIRIVRMMSWHPQPVTTVGRGGGVGWWGGGVAALRLSCIACQSLTRPGHQGLFDQSSCGQITTTERSETEDTVLIN